MDHLWFSWLHKKAGDGSVEYESPGVHEHAGFGRVRHKLISHLQRAGMAVLHGGPPEEGAIQIAHTQPFDEAQHRSIWERQADRAILYTTFESEILPTGWVDRANEFDAVWVTSQWCRDVFIANGVRVPVHVIPHGIEPGQSPKMRRPVNRESYSFLWMGMNPGDMRSLRMAEPEQVDGPTEEELEKGATPFDWYNAVGVDPGSAAARTARAARLAQGDRKQAALVREAFFRLRHSGRLGEDARLVLKWTTLHSPKFLWRDLPIDYDWVTCYGANLGEDEMRSLLFNADCSVYPSRCEGFGMIPLEHMATGLPCILTPWSGVEDYLWDGPARDVVPGEFLPTDWVDHTTAMGLALKYDRGASFYTEQVVQGRKFDDRTIEIKDFVEGSPDGFGRDAHPRLESLMDLMEWCYRNRGEAAAIGAAAAEVIHREWRWDRAVKAVIDSLTELGWADDIEWIKDSAKERASSVVFPDLHRLDMGVA